MSEWSNLPNGVHIDSVLAHVRANPDKWTAAWDVARGAAYDAACDACAALIAWDEAGDLLSAPIVVLRFLAQEEVPVAVLLLPAAIAMEVGHEEAVNLKEADQLAVKHRATDLGIERRSEYRTYAMNTAELAALIADVRSTAAPKDEA